MMFKKFKGIKRVRIAFFYIALLPQSLSALAADQSQEITDGVITQGNITQGKFVEKNATNAPTTLTNTAIPTGSKISTGRLTDGSFAVVSGVVSVTDGTLSNVTIENVTLPVSGVSKVGTLMEADITGTNISDAALKTTKQPANPSTQTATNISYLGDSLEIKADIPTFENIDKPTDIRNATQGACFRISGEDQNTLYGNFSTGKTTAFWPKCTSLWWGEEDGRTYKINKSALINRNYERHGFTYGVMAMPFKYDTRAKKFEQAGTLGPYLAYGEKSPGISIVWTFFAGATQASITTTENNVTTTSNQNGYSIATGPMVTIKDVFTVGIFAGIDYFQQLTRTWTGVNFTIKSSN